VDYEHCVLTILILHQNVTKIEGAFRHRILHFCTNILPVGKKISDNFPTAQNLGMGGGNCSVFSLPLRLMMANRKSSFCKSDTIEQQPENIVSDYQPSSLVFFQPNLQASASHSVNYSTSSEPYSRIDFYKQSLTPPIWAPSLTSTNPVGSGGQIQIMI